MSMKVKKKFRRGKDGLPYHREGNNQSVMNQPQNEPATSDTEDPAKALNSDDQVALTHSDHYGYLMKKFEYVAMLEKDLVFSIMGYDTQKRSIKQQEHIFIIRKAMKVPESYDLLYSCSCDLERQQFAQSLGNEVTQPLETVFKGDACIHIKALQMYLVQYDEESGIDAQSLWSLGQASSSTEELDHKYHMALPQELFCAVPGGPCYIGVRPASGKWGVCTFIYNKVSPPVAKLRCGTCCKNTCDHILCLQKKMDECDIVGQPGDLAEFVTAFQTTPQMRNYIEACSQSEAKVPIFDEKGEPDGMNSFINLQHRDGRPFVIPDEGVCDRCQHQLMSNVDHNDTWLQVKECPIACLFCIKKVDVYFRPCMNCSCRKMYDGVENHILFMGSFGFTHSVMKDYLRLFITGDLPLHRYYKSYTLRQICAGNLDFCKTISYNKFRIAISAFIRLLDIEFREGFHCTLCGISPDKIVIDGTALGLQKTFMPPPAEKKRPTEVFDGSRFERRNFLGSKQTRERLKQYCDGCISNADFQKLMNEVTSTGLHNLLADFDKEGFQHECPHMYRPLLKALASDQAVCGLLPASACDIVLDIANGTSPHESPHTHMKVLQENIPVLFDLFSQCGITSLPLREILKEMVEKCKAPFVDENGLWKEPHSLVPAPQGNSMDGYFPCLPQIVERGVYVQDKLNRSKDECSKASTSKRRHPSLTPGLFIFNCVHGVCYGFQMMRNHESPDVPFTVLRTRFPKAPSVIIYDNACKLHQYCLNRDPAFFKSSKFMVDKFHWLNHKACSEGYNISRYPKFSKFNSQAAEQLNSAIKPLASMLCYMQHDNFIHFTKLHIWFRNMLRKYKTAPHGDFSYAFVFLAMSNFR